ncbi:MAG: ChaN family lipoprotein [Acidobacteriota bacterium]
MMPSQWRKGMAATFLVFGASLSAEEILRLPIGDPARRDRDAAVVLDAITDTGSGAVLTPSELPGKLTDVRLLLVGEEHTDMDSHAVERRVIEELHRAGRHVLVGLEMYPYTAQSALDDWSAGKLSEDAFLESSHWYKHWGYNWFYYRDIFLFARENRLRVFGVNAPREVVSAVRKKGFQGLTPEEAAHIPTKIDTGSADHMRLFRASFEDASFHAGMSEEQWQAMLNAQCTWDATMAFQALHALEQDADPKAILVVLVGAGHVEYGLGIERQARQWFAGRIASIIPVPVADVHQKPVRAARASYANFLWGVPPEGDPLFPDLGVSTRPVEGQPRLEVINVEKDSPGQHADVRDGDVLVSLDGTPLPDRETLARVMAAKRWGDASVLVVRRGEDTVSLRLLFRREAGGSAAKAP